MISEAISPFTTALIGLGGWGFVIVALVTGIFVTKRAYEEKTAEAKEWKAAFEKEREARVILERDIVPMQKALDTNNHVLETIRDEAREVRARQQ